MVFTIFYVSQSLLHGPDAVAQVQDIIDRSTLWNASMGVTGALAFTERHFAQCIEGGEDTIRALMVRIENDPRHANVTIRRARPERVRRFERWSMAYWGPEIFFGTAYPAAHRTPAGECRRRPRHRPHRFDARIRLSVLTVARTTGGGAEATLPACLPSPAQRFASKSRRPRTWLRSGRDPGPPRMPR